MHLTIHQYVYHVWCCPVPPHQCNTLIPRVLNGRVVVLTCPPRRPQHVGLPFVKQTLIQHPLSKAPLVALNSLCQTDALSSMSPSGTSLSTSSSVLIKHVVNSAFFFVPQMRPLIRVRRLQTLRRCSPCPPLHVRTACSPKTKPLMKNQRALR